VASYRYTDLVGEAIMLIDNVCQIPGCETVFGQHPDFEAKIDPPYCSDNYEPMGIENFARAVKTPTAAAQEPF